METKPMPLDALSAAHDGLDEFRVTAPREIAVLLKQLCDGSLPLHLNAGNGSVFTTTIWTSDTIRGTLGFNADASNPALQALLEGNEVVVVAYLDAVKLQFDVHDLVLVRGARASVLSCSLPREIYRFQRRNAYRVRPLLRGSHFARVRHPTLGKAERELRVLDVSIGGCAVFLPDDVKAPPAGTLIHAAQMDLDADTRFQVSMRLQHVTFLPAAHGARLGLEFVRPSGDAQRSLQRFIDQTQKRGKLMALV